jgi:hypothetical protein
MELRGAAKEDAKRALYDTVTQVPLYGYSVFIVSVGKFSSFYLFTLHTY